MAWIETLFRRNQREDKKLLTCISLSETSDFEGLIKSYPNLERTDWANFVGEDADKTPIFTTQVSSEGFGPCIGMALTGINKKGQRIGMIFHDYDRTHDDRNINLEKRFQEFIGMCSRNTIQGVVVGGHTRFYGHQKTVDYFKNLFSKKIGKSIEYINMEETGATDVLLDIENCRLFVYKR